jgi:hypothetical protein
MQWSVVVVTPPLMILSLLVGMAALNGKNLSSKGARKWFVLIG